MIYRIEDFDTCLWTLGGRTSLPKNALRVATGINAVHSKSTRSRNGNVSVNGSIVAQAAVRFYSHTYVTDAAGVLYKDFVSVTTGLGSNVHASFVKAPPHFGASGYLFCVNGTKPIKVDSTGAVTNWGIPQPQPTATVALSSLPNSVVINNLTSTTGLVAISSATLGTDTNEYITAPSSVTVAIPAGKNGGVKQTGLSLNLSPNGSSQHDAIEFFIQIDAPDFLKALTLQFEYNNSGFKGSLFHISIPISSLVADAATTAASNAANMDAVAQATLNSPGWQFVGGNQMQAEYSAALINYMQNRGGNATPPKTGPNTSVFSPSSGAQQWLDRNGITVSIANNVWWLVRIPIAAFKKRGGASWNNITGWRMAFQNLHSTTTVNIWLNNLDYGGGAGMLGDYQYCYSYENSTTGSYSNPGPPTSGTNSVLVPLTVTGDDRAPVNLTGLPTSAVAGAVDPQIDTLVLWRTMGNGGIFYRLATIPLSGFDGTFMDAISDFIGFGPSVSSLPNWAGTTAYGANVMIMPTSGNAGKYVYIAYVGGTSGSGAPTWPQSVGAKVVDGTVTWQNIGNTLTLSLESCFFNNVLPATTVTQCVYFNGTMFLCGDTAVGARGRIYYSQQGYAEGVAGYTDITNDDDPTVGFGVFDNALFVFTTKGVWRIVDLSINTLLPGFSAVPVTGAVGCISAQSITVMPAAIIYQGADGLYAFDGYFSRLIASHLLPLFRGDTIEGYAAIGTIIASCWARGEYVFSDGTATYAVNLMPGSIPNGDTATREIARCIVQAGCHALYFEPDTGKILAGYAASGTYHLEENGVYLDSANAVPMAWAVRPAALYSSDKYTLKGKRILIDINPGGNTITVNATVDGTDYSLGTLTGSSDAQFEFTFNKTGYKIGIYLTATITSGQIELFHAAVEGNVSGGEDKDA